MVSEKNTIIHQLVAEPRQLRKENEALAAVKKDKPAA